MTGLASARRQQEVNAVKPDTILIVDDEPALGLLAAETLGDAGLKTETVERGQDALDRLAQCAERYQAVLLDRRMPDIDGLTVLRQMKSGRQTRDIPVVLLTGLASEADIVAGIDAGAYYYATKPCPEPMLVAVVRAACEDFQARLALHDEIATTTGAIALIDSGTFRFRTPAQARALAGLLAHCSATPAAVVTGLWELLMNAVEHGLLHIGYGDKSALLRREALHSEIETRLALPAFRDLHAEVSVAFDEDAVVYTIADHGPGFEPARYFEFDPARATHAHGRGIAMARRLSFSTLDYIGNGNTVRATSQRARPQ